MSPDTSWSTRRSCMTEADCARPPRGGSSPPGSETLEYLCFSHRKKLADFSPAALHGRRRRGNHRSHRCDECGCNLRKRLAQERSRLNFIDHSAET